MTLSYARGEKFGRDAVENELRKLGICLPPDETPEV